LTMGDPYRKHRDNPTELVTVTEEEEKEASATKRYEQYETSCETKVSEKENSYE
jgi:hypothetical protein